MANAAIDLLTFDEFLTLQGLKVNNPNVDQVQIELLITAASRVFQTAAAGRVFLSASDAQELDGHGGMIQYCRYPPVTSLVIAYWNVSEWVTASTALYPRELNTTTGEVRMTSSPFSRNLRWRLSYTGGWTQVLIPEDIKVAVFDLVQRSRKRVEGKQGVRSDGRADQQSRFDLHLNMTPQIQAVAESYRVIYNP